MKEQRQNKLKQILLEALIIVGFALVLAVYLAAAETVLVLIVGDYVMTLLGKELPEFLPVFRTPLIPNFIVLHIEFARMFREAK